MSEMDRALAKARSYPGFMERLQSRMVKDKAILDRLHDEPCPATEVGVLGFEKPTVIPCGKLRYHKGPHSFYMEWVT